ncbi:polysaccharide deacetylase family protein [Roseomonas stagni]|uniref:Polysaccharide deacetylase family protein n=1 Tax=Falsiroseomonas algicola TaxID=2716930 RepID=A0A6M1LQ39_9PROT|nr:polysaccharide deacetylase family protein [Falsiroseomonas algicola]NGM22528.1 polysaccharide deacetylase family protein [Falsiroseomonas algicola]
MKLPDQNRYAPSAIISRPDYAWPEGRRLAVQVFTNIEHHAFRAGLGSDSTVAGSPQTQRNYAWRDYGNRVGIWNILALLDELGLPAAHNCNSAALDLMPEIGRAILARGDEFVGHGRTNAERQEGMWEEDERRLIQQSRDGIARHAGRAPRGWLGPWLSQGTHTLDLLKEEGFDYMMDWPADDQPFWMATRSGPILSIPYSVELNDSPAMVFRHHTGREFAEMITDQFDEMLEQSRHRPLVMSIVLHSFVVGQPFRLRPLRDALKHILAHRDRLWITRPAELAAHVAGLPRGIVPGSEMLG